MSPSASRAAARATDRANDVVALEAREAREAVARLNAAWRRNDNKGTGLFSGGDASMYGQTVKGGGSTAAAAASLFGQPAKSSQPNVGGAGWRWDQKK
jgi:hypothetical protein